MAFGKKKDGLYLRPRVRRTTPLLDIAFAVVVGGVSGAYIFNDTFQRWQHTETMLENDQSAGKPVIPVAGQQSNSSSADQFRWQRINPAAQHRKMSDVAQILGLNGASGAPSTAAGDTDAVSKELQGLKPTGGTPAARGKTKKPKKLTGMQREVLELLESNHRVNHALYPGVSKLTLQQKWKERKDRPAVQWLRKSFQNPARAELAGEQDPHTGLTLTHWVKAHVTPPDYVFARFNVKCDVVKYTDEEYAAALETHVDPVMKWTKDETDVLLELCARHDLRWIVVADKYNTHAIAKGAFRSVEDVKYRYYEVARLVSEYRDRVEAEGGDEDVKPKTGDAVIKAEETDATVAKPASSGEVAASTAVAVDGHTVAEPLSKYFRFNVTYEKQRKRQLEAAFTRSIEEENEVKRLSDELRVVEQHLKKAAVKVDTKKKKELADVPYEIQREFPTGVFLRSQTLALPPPTSSAQKAGTSSSHGSGSAATLSAKLLKKMELMLEEMGVPSRPMPTKLTCEMFDTLRQDTLGLLSLRKHLAAKQSELQTLKERYQALTGNEFKPMTPALPSRKAARRGDATDGAGAAGGADEKSTQQISKGKSLKTAGEKQLRGANKRRGSTVAAGAASKRNKKNL